MVFNYNDNKYEIVIIRKNNKNTYIRVKDDLKIYVTTSLFTSDNMISKLITENYSTITRMLQKMESDKDHYLSLVDNTPIASAEPESSDSNVSSEIDKNQKVEYPYAQPIIYDEDMFKEVKTPSHKSSSSEELDLEMFSRFTPEYLRSVSEYLTILADLKDAENRSKAIQSKLS